MPLSRDDFRKHAFRFKAGMVIIIASFPLCYGGIAAAIATAAITKQPRYLWWAAVSYAASWALIGIGALVGGQGAALKSRSLWRRAVRRLRRWRRHRALKSGSKSAAKMPHHSN